MLRSSGSLLIAALLLLGCRPEPGPGLPGELRCGSPYTAIHDVQGSGRSSPMQGRVVEIEGVVTADFRAGLGGVFVQAPLTVEVPQGASSGLFVELDPASPAPPVGALWRVRGEVAELGPASRGLTALINLSGQTVCAASAEAGWVELDEPPADSEDWERWEGMRVRIGVPLVVIDSFGIERNGTLDLAFGERVWIPTDRVEPGEAARALDAENQRRRLRVDDGSLAVDPAEVWYLPEALPPRLGSRVGNVQGIVDQRDGEYRLQLLAPLELVEAAERPLTPPEVGGRLRVANFNVENYFNGDGRGGGFPTSRGARSAAAFARQREMVSSAILGLGADVYALIELENDGFGPYSAIADLVQALNEAGADFAFADPGVDRVGSDEITVAIVYRPSRVRALGPAVLREGPPFDRLHRVPMAQAFEDIETGTRFTVGANHFKSKRCGREDDRVNADRGDGQACFNPARVEAAQALAEWLAGDPAGSGSPHVLILGDLNAYSEEDPLRLLRRLGWVHLRPAEDAPGAQKYTYVFRGQKGSLDHALASPSLAPAVTGVASWAINASEPWQLAYDRAASLEEVRGRFWRSSDHNPQLLGLDFERLPRPDRP